MKLKISNFRGISRADIETAVVTLLLGKNYQGKTSAIQGAQAVLTGEIIPVEDLPKSSVARLIHSGGGGGAEVSATVDSGSKTIIYPECTVSSTGEPFEISHTAAGLSSIIDIPTKLRSVEISKMLNAEPGDAEISESLQKIGLDKNGVEKVLQTIHAQGWDAAHAHAKETGAKLKGRWESVTLDRYGDKKAASWLPAEWEGDLSTSTEENLAAELKQETEWFDTAKTDEAVSVSELQRLGTISVKLPTLRDSLKFKNDEITGLQKTEKTLRDALSVLPTADQPKHQPCPHCGKSVCVETGKVIAAKLIESDELQRRKTAIDEATKSLQDLSAQINKKRDEIAETKREIVESESASKKEAELKELLARPQTDKKSIEDCQSRVKRAESRLLSWRRKRDADLFAGGITINQQIVAELSPTGMRLEVLKKCLSTFNGFLKQVCDAAVWRIVELKDDMSVSMNGTPYMLLSESEKFRVRVALQVATAKYDGSEMVLIDKADILDSAGRNGLISMVLASGLQAVIGMTIDDRGIGEKIKQIGGAAYWIENGVAEKI